MDEVFRYLERGWFVFPVQPSKKIPYKGFAWKEKSTNDVEKIRKVLAHPAYEGCNWALDCGKSNIFVVDVDTKKNGFESLRNLQSLDANFVVKTPSGGAHYYFVGAGPNSVEKLGPGIDTRGSAGYVLIPGSKIADKSYELISSDGIAEIPQWILDTLGAPKDVRIENADIPIADQDNPRDIKTAVNYLVNRAPEAIEGSGGDQTTYEVCCRLRDFNLSPEKILELLIEHWNDAKAHPPWDYSSLKRKVANAYKYAKDRPGNATPEAMFPDPSRSTKTIRCAADVDPLKLSPRQWLLGYRYLPEYVTLTIAPGGVGKSLLTILEGLSIASGKQLTQDPVRKTGAVWLFNTEDPFDELDRRVVAAAKFHKLSKQDMAQFYYSSGYDNPLKLVAADDHNRPIVNTGLVDAIIKQIRLRSVKLFILDPFVECHDVNENDNSAIATVAQAFRKIAKETGCAVSLVHHTSKGKQERGNMDKSRGASALVSAARIAHTLYPMTEKEAQQYGLPTYKAPWYVRLDDAKANLAPPGLDAAWYEKHSVRLFFDSEETTGTLAPIQFEAPEFSVDESIAPMYGLPFDAENKINLNAAAKALKDCGYAGSNNGTTISSIRRRIETLFNILPDGKTPIDENGFYIQMVVDGRTKLLRRFTTVKTCLRKGEADGC